MAMGRLLLVDDDRALRDAVGRALRLEGYEVVLATDGREALDVMARERADLVLLDVSMPSMSGVEVCRRIRAAGDPAGVLMLTARDGISERVAGLDAGADDYLVKPFALDELLARVRAGIRRCAALASDVEDPPAGELDGPLRRSAPRSRRGSARCEQPRTAAGRRQRPVLAHRDCYRPTTERDAFLPTILLGSNPTLTLPADPCHMSRLGIKGTTDPGHSVTAPTHIHV
jgi:DNA-binding response OmpR family regulator